jgi:hypothetical protein
MDGKSLLVATKSSYENRPTYRTEVLDPDNLDIKLGKVNEDMSQEDFSYLSSQDYSLQAMYF